VACQGVPEGLEFLFAIRRTRPCEILGHTSAAIAPVEGDRPPTDQQDGTEIVAADVDQRQPGGEVEDFVIFHAASLETGSHPVCCRIARPHQPDIGVRAPESQPRHGCVVILIDFVLAGFNIDGDELAVILGP